jgi:hypothetical protein
MNYNDMKSILETFFDGLQQKQLLSTECLPVGEVELFWGFVVLVLCKVLFLSQFLGAAT